jgi:hypothetical protein
MLPLAIGAAILRYQLCDLDRIICRTLAYGLLPAGGYADIVLGLGRLVGRDQVDLDTLSSELLALVDQTMQPTRTSLWRPRGQSTATDGTAALQSTGTN